MRRLGLPHQTYPMPRFVVGLFDLRREMEAQIDPLVERPLQDTAVGQFCLVPDFNPGMLCAVHSMHGEVGKGRGCSVGRDGQEVAVAIGPQHDGGTAGWVVPKPAIVDRGGHGREEWKR